MLTTLQTMTNHPQGPRQYTGIAQTAAKIIRDEGITALWKGNSVLIIRIFPYSAAQLAANDTYKRIMVDHVSQELTVTRRLAAGGCAGMTALALTHPLDTARLRLSLPNHPYKGALNVFCVGTLY
jgi:solute carrier family 25 phosphate transporter 23/24/25/41